jgi:hypothetical protein
MDRWEEKRIDRLEDRVVQLERKNWERSDFAFRLIMHGLTAVFVVLTVVAVVISALHSAHS